MCVKGFEGIAWLSTCLGLELESMIYAMLGFTCRCQHVLNHSRLDRIKYCVVSRVQCREANRYSLINAKRVRFVKWRLTETCFPLRIKLEQIRLGRQYPTWWNEPWVEWVAPILLGLGVHIMRQQCLSVLLISRVKYLYLKRNSRKWRKNLRRHCSCRHHPLGCLYHVDRILRRWKGDNQTYRKILRYFETTLVEGENCHSSGVGKSAALEPDSVQFCCRMVWFLMFSQPLPRVDSVRPCRCDRMGHDSVSPLREMKRQQYDGEQGVKRTEQPSCQLRSSGRTRCLSSRISLRAARYCEWFLEESSFCRSYCQQRCIWEDFDR